jgi:acyl carrier protein phosphodiesterase
LPTVNHLAHLLTAGDDNELRLGVLLGDHVRGRVERLAYPERVRLGIRLHRRVDGWTDRDPALTALRAAFGPTYRRYAGILLDVWFDHLLSRDWSRHCARPLARFNDEVLALLAQHRDGLPDGLRRFHAYARRTGVLCRYADTDTLAEVLAGIGARLRRPVPLQRALPELRCHDADIAAVFEVFWPRLMDRAAAWRERPD